MNTYGDNEVVSNGMDTLVFDIETQNFFTDPDVGWDNFTALRISVVGVYSYDKNQYFCFEENEMEKLAELFRGANKVVGFASNRYDVPVLNLYFQKLKDREALNLWQKERIDLLDIVERATGKRVSLGRLSEANLGKKKEGKGAEAPGMFARGEIKELKEYCLKDVELTKELYDIYEKEKSFLVPKRDTGEMERVVFSVQSKLELV